MDQAGGIALLYFVEQMFAVCAGSCIALLQEPNFILVEPYSRSEKVSRKKGYGTSPQGSKRARIHRLGVYGSQNPHSNWVFKNHDGDKL